MLHCARDFLPSDVSEIPIRRSADISDSLRDEWTDLAEVAAQPNSFAEPWFVEASLPHFAPAGGLRLLQVRRGGRLAGLALLDIACAYGRAPLAHVENWRHHNHFLGAPLIRIGEEAAFWEAILAKLDGARWARGFLHVTGLVEHGPVHRGLAAAAAALGRGCPIVHRHSRPLMETDLDPEDYYQRNVSGKRRGEHRRQMSRLCELGEVAVRALDSADEVPSWCEEFMALEAGGWKGKAGSAIACSPATADFFRQSMAGAFAAGRLRFLRLDLDGRAIAMLTCLLAPPGAFGFKSAFDEDYSRFSPGMLLHVENLKMFDQPEIAWTDSCAGEAHPLATLWSERRSVIRVSVRLKGLSRGLAYGSARLLEKSAGLVRGRIIAA
jgi:CelD/BcsL family acetyltransferase involved in cellulose biosynthesis